MDYERQVTKQISQKLSDTLDDYFIEGLRRKGFEFKNRIEIEAFIKNRCRCADDLIKKEKTYFVDDNPFFLYVYGVEPLDLSYTNNREFKITANAGYYSFL